MNKIPFMEENFPIIIGTMFLLMVSFVTCLYLISNNISKLLKERYPEHKNESVDISNLFILPLRHYLDVRIEKLNDSDINKNLNHLKLLVVVWWIICMIVFLMIDVIAFRFEGVGRLMFIAAVAMIGIMLYQIRKKKLLLELVLEKYPELYEGTLKGLTSSRNNPFSIPNELIRMEDVKAKEYLRVIKIMDYLPFVVVFITFVIIFQVVF